MKSVLALVKRQENMQLRTLARNFEMDPLLEDHIERHFRIALGRFAGAIGCVIVHLEDLNGHFGGAGYHCQVDVILIPTGTLTVEATGIDANGAVCWAANQIQRRVRCELNRRRRGKPIALIYPSRWREYEDEDDRCGFT